MRRVCAWCGHGQVEPGRRHWQVFLHGICDACLDAIDRESELAATEHEHAAAVLRRLRQLSRDEPPP